MAHLAGEKQPQILRLPLVAQDDRVWSAAAGRFPLMPPAARTAWMGHTAICRLPDGPLIAMKPRCMGYTAHLAGEKQPQIVRLPLVAQDDRVWSAAGGRFPPMPPAARTAWMGHTAICRLLGDRLIAMKPRYPEHVRQSSKGRAEGESMPSRLLGAFGRRKATADPSTPFGRSG
jgi:hypothetical protein